MTLWKASTGPSCTAGQIGPSHSTKGGKLETIALAPLRDVDDLSMAYTPGVARVCMAIYNEPDLVREYTIKKNMVAIVTDGTAVLGLGDIGPCRGAARHGGQRPSSSSSSPASTRSPCV